MTISMSSIRPFGVRSASIKTNKKSKYNLSDGEEDDFEFQSLGALSERDDFEDDVLPADDDDVTETTQTKITGDGRNDSGNPFDCDTSSESIICTQGLTGWRERIAGIFDSGAGECGWVAKVVKAGAFKSCRNVRAFY
ncbi:ribosome biogenesis protein ERB1-like isoform X1 [Malus domestica]|uniref:ribosome biogenesis protein ERB1-like isoform X1 n=2 Tax=Malus domestica TaxID=3750 RepID=UPI0039758E72